MTRAKCEYCGELFDTDIGPECNCHLPKPDEPIELTILLTREQAGQAVEALYKMAGYDKSGWCEAIATSFENQS